MAGELIQFGSFRVSAVKNNDASPDKGKGKKKERVEETSMDDNDDDDDDDDDDDGSEEEEEEEVVCIALNHFSPSGRRRRVSHSFIYRKRILRR